MAVRNPCADKAETGSIFFFVNDRQQIAMSHLCALKVHQLASPFAKLLSYIWFYFRSAVKCTHSLARVERQKWLSFLAPGLQDCLPYSITLHSYLWSRHCPTDDHRGTNQSSIKTSANDKIKKNDHPNS